MAYTKASGNVKTREYGLEYYALSSFEHEPAILGEYYKKYGKGLGFYDFLTIANNVVDIYRQGSGGLTRDTITAFEEGAEVQPIRVNASGISTSTTAGDSISFTLHADEYDSDNNTYLRVGDSIIIPPEYLSENNPAAYRVSAVGATSSAACTATPFRATAQITTSVPANAYLMVGFTSFGRGSGQPSPKSTYGYQRSFKTHIIKDEMEITGGMIAQETYRENLKGGGEGLFLRSQLETERRLDGQADSAIFLSDENDNSVTETDANSNTVSVKTTKGLWNHLEALAQELNYVTRFSISDFDTAKDLFRSQGVVDTEVAFLVGPKLVTQLDNMGLDFIKEYSGGSDLSKNMNELGINFNAFNKNGMKYVCKELVSFSNPNTYGTDKLANFLGNAGIMLPMADVKISDPNRWFSPEGGTVSIPNVSVGYLKNNGEDRERIFKVRAGMNGINLPAMEEYDRISGGFLSEFALIAMQVNQMIKVVKQGTY